jgi:hypothetical protein
MVLASAIRSLSFCISIQLRVSIARVQASFNKVDAHGKQRDDPNKN